MFYKLRDGGLPRSLRQELLIDHALLPRYWAVVWGVLSLGALAPATRVKKLRQLERLYCHVDRLYGAGALDTALGTLDLVALAGMLESWFVSIRNQAVTSFADEQCWLSGLGFVTGTLTGLIHVDPANRTLRSVEQRLQQLNLLYGQLHIQKRRSAEPIRSLPASVVEVLYDILDPESRHNPFKQQRTRWRVYVAFILMLHQGLRRGEVLILATDSVKSAVDRKQGCRRYWLNVRQNPNDDGTLDARHSRPGIKTVYSIRQVPVSELVARIIQVYVENYRGRPEHPYMLNSQLNSPLSTESVTKLFATITRSLPVSVMKELQDRTGKVAVAPHDLRHTCAVIRLRQLLEQGDSIDVASSKMRTFFGWSKSSDMPFRYARAVFEDRLANVWNNAFDDRVEVLRAIPK